MHHPADRNTPPATTTAAAAAATRTTGTAGAGAGAMHKLSNDYDDLTYRTGQPPLSASSQRPRMHIDDSIHPYHVTANHRVPQSDSDAQVSAALYPLTSPTNSTSTGRHFQTAGPFYRPASPTTSTCVSCFGVRTKPYNAKLVATSNRNPRNGGSSRSRGKNASSPSPVDGTQCKAYHRLTLVMSLIAAVLSLAALAITLLVFLGILKTDMTGSCECNAQNGILGQPANTATTTAMPASKFPVSTPTPITNAPLANTSEQCTPVCNASLASLVRGERGPRGQQGPIGPAGPQGAQGIPWVCPVTGWIQFGQTCIGEAEPGSIFTYEAGRSKCAEIANAPGAKPLVITSRWLALMAFTLAVREESIWTSLQTGEDGLLKGAGGQSVNALTNSALYKNNNLSGAGCDYISEFTGPTLHPVVRRGSCDTKRPALCIVQP
ncbi:uncharacterized protein LOC135819102 [Sycon ciliatum]|uniref:uncharacterized protein LOC135819102 n=1 Tax=Sycon ciliatum TaxID=27933 RepID=UPI0031F6A399